MGKKLEEAELRLKKTAVLVRESQDLYSELQQEVERLKTKEAIKEGVQKPSPPIRQSVISKPNDNETQNFGPLVSEPVKERSTKPLVVAISLLASVTIAFILTGVLSRLVISEFLEGWMGVVSTIAFFMLVATISHLLTEKLTESLFKKGGQRS